MSALYDHGREGFLNGEISWGTDDIRLVLVDADAYSVNLATHKFLTHLPAGARVATSGSLTGKTTAAGVADADDVTLEGVNGATVEALVLYKHTGDEATSRLIAYIDNFTVNGGAPPLTPNGGDVTVQWDSGPNRIFKL